MAVEVPRLAAMTMDLQDMFKRHRYDDAVIFGHALDGTPKRSNTRASCVGDASHETDARLVVCQATCTCCSRRDSTAARSRSGTGP